MTALLPRFKKALNNQKGDMSFYTCFLIVFAVALISFVLLFASIQINIINIRNGIKMELNNLSAIIYADIYRSQRESNFEELIRTLYSSSSYTRQLEETVQDGLATKLPLSTDDYRLSNIRLQFSVPTDAVEYVFFCDTDYYISMFGNRYTVYSRQIRITGHHNTKF